MMYSAARPAVIHLMHQQAQLVLDLQSKSYGHAVKTLALSRAGPSAGTLVSTASLQRLCKLEPNVEIIYINIHDVFYATT